MNRKNINKKGYQEFENETEQTPVGRPIHEPSFQEGAYFQQQPETIVTGLPHEHYQGNQNVPQQNQQHLPMGQPVPQYMMQPQQQPLGMQPAQVLTFNIHS